MSDPVVPAEALTPGEVLASMFDMVGRRVLVTGAASGLGLAMTEIMVDCGAHVVMADIDWAGLDRESDRLSNRAGTVRCEQLDIADVEAVRDVVGRMVAQGGIDVAFANAGGGIPQDETEHFIRGLDKSWDFALATNLNGNFATIQAAATAMKAHGSGSIVITASTAGLRGDPMVSYSYTAVKGALVNLTRHAALELAPFGVRVNAIAPGPFHTNIGAAAKRAGVGKTDDDWNRTIPMGRMGEPYELKGLALLLASPAGSFMTGGVYPVDGGALVAYAR
jgi:NAD(P)-dependent dehydrogenase (short-subunit alcohol dehydrogenase family)